MRILRRFNLFLQYCDISFADRNWGWCQRYVRTYVESGIIGVYVSIVLVYALILFGGGGGGGGGVLLSFSFYDGYVGCIDT